jgi:hypothetical protein
MAKENKILLSVIVVGFSISVLASLIQREVWRSIVALCVALPLIVQSVIISKQDAKSPGGIMLVMVTILAVLMAIVGVISVFYE